MPLTTWPPDFFPGRGVMGMPPAETPLPVSFQPAVSTRKRRPDQAPGHLPQEKGWVETTREDAHPDLPYLSVQEHSTHRTSLQSRPQRKSRFGNTRRQESGTGKIPPTGYWVWPAHPNWNPQTRSTAWRAIFVNVRPRRGPWSLSSATTDGWLGNLSVLCLTPRYLPHLRD